MQRLVPSILILSLAGTAVAQSPWTREAGGGYFQLSAYTIQYDQLHRNSGPDFDTSREITDTTVEAYGEYGLTDEWTLVGRAPLKLLDAGSANAASTVPLSTLSDSFTAFGNLALGARRQLLLGEYVVAAQFDIEFPTGDFDRDTGLSSGYDAFTFSPSVAAGRSFDWGYASAYAGIDFRTDDFSSSWNVGGQAGTQISDRFAVAVTLDIVQSFQDGDVQLPRANLETGLYLNDQEWVALTLQGRYALNDAFGVQASIGGGVPANNVAKGAVFGLGFYYSW